MTIHAPNAYSPTAGRGSSTDVRARTLLVLGQLHRRQRRKQAAEAPLVEALLTFEKLGTPLWAKRARAELDRTNVSLTSDRELTPSERQAAELAATA